MLDGEWRVPDLTGVTVDDAQVKDHAIKVVQAGIHKMTGVNVGKAGAKLLVEAALEALLFGAIRAGYLRLPRGFGSFHLKTPKPFSRKLPTGQVVEVTKPRASLRYVEGLAIREVLRKTDKYSARRKPRVAAIEELGEWKPPAKVNLDPVQWEDPPYNDQGDS